MTVTRRRFLAGAATLAGVGVAASCLPVSPPTAPPPTTPATLPPPPLGMMAQQVFGPGGQAVIRVDAQATASAIEPGAFGYGAMWPARSLWSAPPASFTDATHDEYVAQLAATNLPLVQAAGMRNTTWPWGNTFGTFGVNWENSIGPWSKRTRDAAPTSGWNEVAIVGVDDLMNTASTWRLEALTLSTPLSVYDGPVRRWGPNTGTYAFSDSALESAAQTALRLIDHLSQHPYWSSLSRVYLEAGCEWRPFASSNLGQAASSYARLVQRIRTLITDPKVVIVASGAESAEFGGVQLLQANAWNQPVYAGLAGTSGIAFDLHKYRGGALTKNASGGTDMTDANVDTLLKTGPRSRGYFVVDPAEWNSIAAPLPSIIAETSILGNLSALSTTSSSEWPWPAIVAQADLAREAFASPTSSYLAWTWFPAANPGEWPYGAVRNGALGQRADALAFMSQHHREQLLAGSISGTTTVRANVTREQGALWATGGNFSRSPVTVSVDARNVPRLGTVAVELLDSAGHHSSTWNGASPLALAPMQLVRMRVI